jgi:hypothetical protein
MRDDGTRGHIKEYGLGGCGSIGEVYEGLVRCTLTALRWSICW